MGFHAFVALQKIIAIRHNLLHSDFDLGYWVSRRTAGISFLIFHPLVLRLLAIDRGKND